MAKLIYILCICAFGAFECAAFNPQSDLPVFNCDSIPSLDKIIPKTGCSTLDSIARVRFALDWPMKISNESISAHLPEIEADSLIPQDIQNDIGRMYQKFVTAFHSDVPTIHTLKRIYTLRTSDSLQCVAWTLIKEWDKKFPLAIDTVTGFTSNVIDCCKNDSLLTPQLFKWLEFLITASGISLKRGYGSDVYVDYYTYYGHTLNFTQCVAALTWFEVNRKLVSPDLFFLFSGSLCLDYWLYSFSPHMFITDSDKSHLLSKSMSIYEDALDLKDSMRVEGYNMWNTLQKEAIDITPCFTLTDDTLHRRETQDTHLKYNFHSAIESPFRKINQINYGLTYIRRDFPF